MADGPLIRTRFRPTSCFGSVRHRLTLELGGELVHRGFELGYFGVNVSLDFRSYRYLARCLQIVVQLLVDLLVLRLQAGDGFNLRLRHLPFGMSFEPIEDRLGFLQLRADLVWYALISTMFMVSLSFSFTEVRC
jgi:hypothetical protein